MLGVLEFEYGYRAVNVGYVGSDSVIVGPFLIRK